MDQKTKIQHVRQAARGSKNDLEKVLDELVNPEGPVKLPSFTVATVPAAANYEGHLIYVTDGADGSPTIAWSNGTDWIEEDGTAIAS